MKLEWKTLASNATTFGSIVKSPSLNGISVWIGGYDFICLSTDSIWQKKYYHATLPLTWEVLCTTEHDGADKETGIGWLKHLGDIAKEV